MTPQLAAEDSDLVKDGATVSAQSRCRVPSLQDYPKCDESVHTIGDEVWGDCDGEGVTEHDFGKGKVVNGKHSLADSFHSGHGQAGF